MTDNAIKNQANAEGLRKLMNSLEVLPQVFAGMKDYRVLGSLLVAAINGGPHRTLHDVDLLVDERVYGEVSKRLQNLGFQKITKRAPGFQWDEFAKVEHLTFGVLLCGRFEKEKFSYSINRWARLEIKNAYLAPTEYDLFGKRVRGIPLRSVYEGIRAASFNPKRKQDRLIVLNKVRGQLPEGPTMYRAFTVRIFGVGFPYVYGFFSQVYNLVGAARLRLGKTYDPWV